MNNTAEKLNNELIEKKVAVEPQRTNNPHLAIIMAIVANALWGASFLASKYTLLVWAPITATVIRFTLALTVMIVAFPMLGFKIRRLSNVSELLRVSLIGLTGFGLLYPMQLRGLTYIPSNLSACLMLTSPLFVILFARIFLLERLSKWKIVAITLGILGGIILLEPLSGVRNLHPLDHAFYVGCGLTLLASAALASSVIITRKSALELNTASLTFWTIFIGTILLLPFSFFETQPISSASNLLPAITAIVFLSIFCSVLCFLLWNRAIALLEAKQLASSMHLKTPVAILVGCLVAHEPLNATIVIGSIIVACGVLISQKQ